MIRGQLRIDWLPAQDTENEVEHEEGPDDDERHEVDPVEVAAHRIVRLKQNEKL